MENKPEQPNASYEILFSMTNQPTQLDLFISEQFKQNARNLKKVLERLDHEYIAPIDQWGEYNVTTLYLAAYDYMFRPPSENTVQLLSHPDQDLVARYFRAAYYSRFGKDRFREYDSPHGCTFSKFQYPTEDNELESKVAIFWDELFSTTHQKIDSNDYFYTFIG